MHRFRKKSETKRQDLPAPALNTRRNAPVLPQDDFRTSLILPDLTRRFSVLQSSAGDTSLSGLKEGFADQRTRNSANAITEEEEDLVLDALHKMRAGYGGNGGVSSDAEDDDDVVQSLRSVSSRGTSNGQPRHYGRSSAASGTDASPPARANGSPRSSRSNKRYSNNLFVGAGQFRDQTYLRSVGSIPRQTSNRSMTSTDSRRGYTSTAGSPQPSTPDLQSATSAPSSPNDSFGSKEELGTAMTATRSAPLVAPYPYTTAPTNVAAHRLSRSFSPSTLSRVSASLDEVLSRLEEAGEDEILVPRKSMMSPTAEAVQAQSSGSSSGNGAAEHAPGTAISADRPISEEGVIGRVASPVPRSGTTSPTPRLPGYIPGMPRPMTPRNFELHDDLRSHSTTPRAASPIVASPSPHLPGHRFRRGSDASGRAESPGPKSPSFIHRSTNGRYTPGGDDGDADALFGRRRPTSPLAGQAVIGAGISRPTTPSRITWTPSHSHSGSVASSTDVHGGARSLRSPALPDSPLIDATIGGGPLMGSLTAASRHMAPMRPPSAMSGLELGGSDAFRASTPSRDTRGPAYGRAQSPKHSSTSSMPFSLVLGSPQSTTFGAFDNSSRSSLASDGSSYHSEDEGKQTRGAQLFAALEPSHTAWHDTPTKDGEAETVVRQLAGLTVQDFVAIQERLLEAARAKPSSPEMQRSPSLRKRKGSIARSIHSLNESPTPGPSGAERIERDRAAAASPPPANDRIQRANALLDTVVTQIELAPLAPAIMEPPATAVPEQADMVRAKAPRAKPIEVKVETSVFHLAPPHEQPAPSSPDRRNRDLARALFGTSPTDATQPQPVLETPTHSDCLASPSPSPKPSSSNLLAEPVGTPSSLQTTPSPSLMPQYAMDPFQLAMDVKRRAEEATAALRKTPSVTRLPDGGSGGSSLARRPIDMRQISTPRLEYASTSVEAIPLQSPGAPLQTPPAQRAKQGSFFKFRGTLRGRPPGLDEHTRAESPHPSGYPSPGLLTPGTPSTPLNKQPSPPTSASAKKGGFMSRFRKTKPEAGGQDIRRDISSPVPAPLTAAIPGMMVPPTLTPGPDMARSAPALTTTMFTGMPMHMQGLSPVDTEPPVMFGTSPPSPPILQAPPARKQAPSVGEPSAPATRHAQEPSQGEAALKQLFDAASSLGLDEAALNEILARSPSVTSTGTWKQSARFTAGSGSLALSQGRPSVEQAMPTITQSRPSGDAFRARSPAASDGRPSLDQAFQFRGQPPPPARSDSLRKAAAVVSPTASEFGALDEQDRADETIVPTRRVPVRSDSTRTKRGTVVRRTLIFASDPRLSTMDLSALVASAPPPPTPPLPPPPQRRPMSSASNQSGRSLVERVPTPPPPVRSKRFSAEGSPPVPRLPASLGGRVAEPGLQVPMSAPPGKAEYPSTYDSLYDMYDEQQHQQRLQYPEDMEARPAIEVIEMANGETVWSIVNGLREDEEDDTWDSRASFISTASLGEQSVDGVQLFFKEHGRTASKGSQASLARAAAPKKPRAAPGGVRPETKVFYSNPEQIARIIEELSRGADSGAFNIMPSPRKAGHAPAPHRGHASTPSAASSAYTGSDGGHGWSVEERLDRMIGQMHGS